MTSIEFDAEGLPLNSEVKTFAEEGIEIPVPKDALATASSTSNCQRTTDNDSGCSLDEFSWVPPGLTPTLVHQYMRSLPESKVPHVGSVGDRYRIMQLLKQLPVQDSNSRYCHGLSDEEKKELRIFCEQRQKESLGRGVVKLLQSSDQGLRCRECNGILKPGDLVVGATRAGDDVTWHPRCFHCHKCRELLVDLIYFIKDGILYCGRHHAETMKPRCIACDEIIFSEECTEAEGQTWHMKHFTCVDCETVLGGQRYIMCDGQPLCCGCYDAIHAERCQACHEVISINQGHLELNGLRWHATDACFRCDTCQQSLVGCHFMPKGDVLYCSDCAVVAVSVLETETEKTKAVDDEVFEEQDMGNTVRKNGCGAESNARCCRTAKKICEEEYEKQCECEFHSAFENQNDIVEGWVDIACTATNQSVKHGCNEQCCLDRNSGLSERSSCVENFGNVRIQQRSRRVEQQFLDGRVCLDDELQNSQLSKEEELIDMYRSQSPKNDDYFDADENADPPVMNSRMLSERFDSVDHCTEIMEGSSTDSIPDEAQGLNMKKQKSNLSQMINTDLEQPRKTKKSVRFDPSTKAARTPSPRDEFRRHSKHRHRLRACSQDDWNLWAEGRGHVSASGYSSDGTRSRPKHVNGYSSDGNMSRPKRNSGYSSDGATSSNDPKSIWSKRASGYSSDGTRPRPKHVNGYSSDGNMSRPKRNSGYSSDGATSSNDPKSFWSKRASGYSSDGACATWYGRQPAHDQSRWPDDWDDVLGAKGEDFARDDSMFCFREWESEDIEKCSTCSSSSDSSETYEKNSAYGHGNRPSTASRQDRSSSLSSWRSLTLPSVSPVAFADPVISGKKKKGKKKNCVVS